MDHGETQLECRIECGAQDMASAAVRVAGGRRLPRYVSTCDCHTQQNVSLIGVYQEGLNAFSRIMANKLACISIITPTGRDEGKISAKAQATNRQTRLSQLVRTRQMGITIEPA